MYLSLSTYIYPSLEEGLPAWGEIPSCLEGGVSSSFTPANSQLGAPIMSLQQHRQIRHRRGKISSSVNKRKGSQCQQDGVENSQTSKAMRYSITNLPEKIWCHIHSLLPMDDAARASCVSRAFLRYWRCRPNLTLNKYTLRSKGYVPIEKFNHIIDCILRKHSGVGLKILNLALDGIANSNNNLDSWLQVIVVPGVEEIILMPQRSNVKYNFPCSILSGGIRNSIRLLKLRFCDFRPTPELGSLGNLTNLCLDNVRITGYELECFLSHSSLALKRLWLHNCQEIICLKIPCESQQLSCLIVLECFKLQVIESKAPNLSNLDLGGKVKFLFEETSQMKKFTIYCSNVLSYACTELPSIMPNLETLGLCSGGEDVHAPMLATKFMYLKHLTISIALRLPPSYDYFSLVSFLDASPSLETLILDVTDEYKGHKSVFGNSSSLRQIDERHYCCLKSVKVTRFSSAKGLVELICHILKNAVSLESLTLDTLYGWRCSEENRSMCLWMGKIILREAPRALEAIRTYIKDKVPATVKLSVMEPCKRCHKVGLR